MAPEMAGIETGVSWASIMHERSRSRQLVVSGSRVAGAIEKTGFPSSDAARLRHHCNKAVLLRPATGAAALPPRSSPEPSNRPQKRTKCPFRSSFDHCGFGDERAANEFFGKLLKRLLASF